MNYPLQVASGPRADRDHRILRVGDLRNMPIEPCPMEGGFWPDIPRGVREYRSSVRATPKAQGEFSQGQGVTSNASTTMEAPDEAGFPSPVTSIVNVCLVLVRPGSVKTVCWGASAAAYMSRESATTLPSRMTRAIPFWGPVKPIQLTDVPVKVNVA